MNPCRTFMRAKIRVDTRADRRDGLVEPNLPFFQRLAAGGLVHNPIRDALPGKESPVLLAGIALVRVSGRFIACDQLLELNAVMHVGAGKRCGPDEVRAFVNADMSLVTISADAVFLG